MSKRLELIGQRFGRLVVVSFAGIDKKHTTWVCLCDCGNIKTLQRSVLRCGYARSCGCLQKETRVTNGTTVISRGDKPNLKHGHTVHESVSPTYLSWASMVQRCTNPNNPSYPNYGGAGVTVCSEWMTFSGFLASMGERPEGTTHGRYLDTGSYCPGNTAWMTWAEQRAEAQKKKCQLSTTLQEAA